MFDGGMRYCEDISQKRRSFDLDCKRANLPVRILVVDDEPDIRLLYEELLEEAGYEVNTAHDGAMAWELLQKYDYDLLITDNQMPKLSGIELLEKLSSNSQLLPAIMVTGTSPDDGIKGLSWAHVKELMKPHTPMELLKVVKNALRSMQSKQITV